MVITIDGPAGAGKSTVAKLVAKRLGVAFLDTGAMYRALTVKAMRRKINLEDADALVALANETVIDLVFEGGVSRVMLDGEDVSEAVRSLDVTNNTFYIARTPGVRQVMVEWQRRMGEKRAMVGDGRDLGTVVYPNAEYKFFLDADFRVRCQRRIDELKAKGQPVDEEALSRDLAERDHQDCTRKVGPLRQADDAVRIDSTGMSIDDVVDLIVRKTIKA